MGRRRFTAAAVTGNIDDLIGLDSIDEEHIHNADIDIKGNLLKTTNLALKQEDATTLAVRDSANSVYRAIRLSELYVEAMITKLGSGTLPITAFGDNVSDILFRSYDSAWRDVLRIINGNTVLVPRATPANRVEGALFYHSTEKRPYYDDGATVHPLADCITGYIDPADADITKTDSGNFDGAQPATNAYDNDDGTRALAAAIDTTISVTFALPDWMKICGARIRIGVATEITTYIEYMNHLGNWVESASKATTGIETWEPTWDAVIAKSVRVRVVPVAGEKAFLYEADIKIER